MHKTDAVIRTPEMGDLIWYFSGNPSWSVGFFIKCKAMDIARPQHSHTNIIYLLPLLSN